jgi:hypothetical protein
MNEVWLPDADSLKMCHKLLVLKLIFFTFVEIFTVNVMKKFILLFAVVTLISCKEKTPPDPNIQDYTSFIFWHNTNITGTLPNCVIGYFDKDGYCWEIADLGDLYRGIKSKEVIINDENITEVFIFSDYYGVVMTDKAFKLKRNYKNIFELLSEYKGIEVDKLNPKQYPQSKGIE